MDEREKVEGWKRTMTGSAGRQSKREGTLGEKGGRRKQGQKMRAGQRPLDTQRDWERHGREDR